MEHAPSTDSAVKLLRLQEIENRKKADKVDSVFNAGRSANIAAGGIGGISGGVTAAVGDLQNSTAGTPAVAGGNANNDEDADSVRDSVLKEVVAFLPQDKREQAIAYVRKLDSTPGVSIEDNIVSQGERNVHLFALLAHRYLPKHLDFPQPSFAEQTSEQNEKDEDTPTPAAAAAAAAEQPVPEATSPPAVPVLEHPHLDYEPSFVGEILHD